MQAGNIDADGRDAVLARLDERLLEENLQEQISKGDLLSRSPFDYLEVLEARYAYLSRQYADRPELPSRLSSARAGVLQRALSAIEKKLDLHSGLSADAIGLDNYAYYVRRIYYFFVLQHRENAISYLVGFAFANRTELASEYKLGTDRKDLEMAALKRSVSFDDAIVLFNLEDVASIIESHVDNSVELIRAVAGADPDEASSAAMAEIFVKEGCIGQLGDGFVGSFLAPLSDAEAGPEILSEARVRYMQIIQRKEVK
jgi:hypothetical protein